MSYQKKPRQKYIRCLERRMEYLEKRVTTSTQDLSYDKAELNALKWATEVLKELYPNPVNQTETVAEGDIDTSNAQEASG